MFGEKDTAEKQVREAIRKKKWSKAIAYYEKKLQENERDFAQWNLLGDLHLNNRARNQAVEAWRRAIEGYALEGLHENVLGIVRKVLRRTPEEEDLHLVMAEAYLGLEYHADCLGALRNYLKLAKQRSESDLRALFRKIIETPIRHAHLLEELRSIFKDAAVDDFELDQRLGAYVEACLAEAKPRIEPRRPAPEPVVEADLPVRTTSRAPEEGLVGLDSFGDDSLSMMEDYRPRSVPGAEPDFDASFEAAGEPATAELPSGEGKDHYDLGLVYKEMKLWEAAISELEQARRDATIRIRATLALAECLQEVHDLQGALNLLEGEEEYESASVQERLNIDLRRGILHELMGNLQTALEHFEAVQRQNAAFGDVDTRVAELRTRIENSQSAF